MERNKGSKFAIEQLDKVSGFSIKYTTGEEIPGNKRSLLNYSWKCITED